MTRIREDFPILARRMAGDLPLVYLDSANTSQKPTAVIDALDDHYRQHNANVARAMHQLGAEATGAFEDGRTKVAAFIGANRREEVVFTKNASEALNLVARVLGDAGRVGEGTDVVITEMEHHSNIVPWQLLTERTGANLRWFGITDEGRLDLDQLDELITERTAVVSLTWVSNMLGTINPLETIIANAPTRSARWSSSTRRRPCRSCPSTSPRWVPTSSRSPATRWSGPPASASCGAATTCWPSSRRSSAAAR